LSQDAPPPHGAGRDALTGGIAAVAILYITNPVSGVALIGGSLVAGYAGKVVLAGLEARLTAAIALREAADQEAAARRARADLDRLATRVAAVPAVQVLPDSSTAAEGSIADVQRFARELQAKHALA
jgi:hypothetical protein